MPFCQADICYCAQQANECSIVECLGRCLPGRPCLVMPQHEPQPFHLGPAGRQGGRCLVLVRVRVLVFLPLVGEGAYLASLGELPGRRVSRKEAWSAESYVYLRPVDIYNYPTLATRKKTKTSIARGGRQCRTEDVRHPCEPG